ncbi:MAG: autotransporter domain-containing protein [Candidatus Omnitrophota bacterium]
MHRVLRVIIAVALLFVSNRLYAAGQFEFGSELSWFNYEEPNFMEEDGILYSFFGGYTYLSHENGKVGSFSELFSNGNTLNRFKVDARIGFGEVDYTSVSTGSADNIDDFIFELRGLAGYDFPVAEDSRITPFIGFGYRYLNDDSSGLRTTTGASGYERESNYFYIPVGVEVATELENDWSLSASVEYDIFISGKQKSHLGDAIAGLNTVENDQNDGFGVRGSVRVVKKMEKFDVFIEPYVRYWKVDDSDVAPITYSGVLVGFGQEPENNSVESGARIGFIF